MFYFVSEAAVMFFISPAGGVMLRKQVRETVNEYMFSNDLFSLSQSQT